MKAAIKTAAGDFDVREVERPRLADAGWAMVRVRVSGICGTDLRHWKVANPKLEGKIMCHELAGEVVEVGGDVAHMRPGGRVLIETLLGDGTCEWCRAQRYNLCPHLYHVRVRSVSRVRRVRRRACHQISQAARPRQLRGAAGKLNAKRLITHRFPLAEINKAFETAADKEKHKSIFVAIES